MIHNPFIVRNVTFGIEDSLISTTGVLVGIAAANFDVKQILVTGIILILIEASSMAFGAFLAEENFIKTSGKKQDTKHIITYAVAMFFAYFLIGLVLLLPFVLGVPHPIPVVLLLAWSLLVVLIYLFEKNVKKIAILSMIGGILMAFSITIGRYLKV